MDNENPNRQGKSFIILGLVSIAILFLIYGRYQDPELITPDAIDSYLRLANGFCNFLAKIKGVTKRIGIDIAINKVCSCVIAMVKAIPLAVPTKIDKNEPTQVGHAMNNPVAAPTLLNPPKIQFESTNEEVAENLMLVERGQYTCQQCSSIIGEYRVFQKRDDASDIGNAKPSN